MSETARFAEVQENKSSEIKSNLIPKTTKL